MTTDEQSTQTVEGDGPDIQDVVLLYEDTLRNYSSYENMQNRNWDTRHMVWPGQSDDQRKHAVQKGSNTKKAFPWENASDIKVPTVDEVINYLVALLVTALSRANLQAVPVGMDDLGKSANVGNFMKWTILSQLNERRGEAELLAQYIEERGIAVMRTSWEKQEQKILQPLKLSDLEANPKMAAVAQSIQTGTADDVLVNLFVSLAEQNKQRLSKKRARKMLKELRETGETTIPTVIATVNRPRLKTLAVGEDIFFPASTPLDIQEASAVFERVWLTPAATRAKIATDGWDSEYTNYVADRCTTGHSHSDTLNTDRKYRTDRVAGGRGPDLREGLCEWVYAYQKLSDEEGVTGLYCTVFCPSAKTDSKENMGWAKHGLLGYRTGKYPYVSFSRETLSRCLLDTRGVAEVAAGWQNAEKVEVDSRIDAASMSTCPTRFHPHGKEPTEWGPGSSVAARRADEYGYFPFAGNPGNSIEVQNTIRKIVRSYFGRPTDEFDANEANVKQRKAVEDFLAPWQKVAEMLWDLHQQYGSDEEWFRVIGAPQARPQAFRKSDYSAKYDFWFSYDVLNNDPEMQITRLKEAGEIAAAQDNLGVFNKAEYMRMVIEALLGSVASERLITPQDVAANKEISSTREDITQMASGIDKDAPTNANVDLRIQVIQQWMQGPPDNPATDVQQMMAEGTPVRKRLERYMKQLQQQKVQQQNATTGRLGAPSAEQK